MRPRFLRWLRAQFLSVGLGFLCRLIRVFADLGDTLAGRLDINDKAFLVGRADDPPIRKRRGSPREATRNDEADHYSSAHLAPFASGPHGAYSTHSTENSGWASANSVILCHCFWSSARTASRR